jgi:secreted trypsin-like serine protease
MSCKFQTCAGNVNRDICSPDISGPLIVQHDQHWELVGIKSWNEHCGQAGFPQVYTKLLYYVDWICTQMRHWKVEHVECHCSVAPAANCPACGVGYVGRIEEIDTDCVTLGNIRDTFVFHN